MTLRFLWHHWADGSVVFDRQTGNTHALAALTRAVHDLLQADAALDDATMVARLGADAAFAHVPDLLAAVREAREKLAACSLIG